MNLAQFIESSSFVACLFELDRDETVLYSQFKSRTQLIDLTSYLAGQNFFNQVFKIENSKDFQRKFKSFISSRQLTDNFIFDCQLAEKIIPLSVMLVFAGEVNQLEKQGVLIVNIRKNDC